MSEFRIKSINASNYYHNDPTKLTGSAEIIHEGTNMEMKIKLDAEDCTRIFAIISQRVADHMTDVAINVSKDLGVQVSGLLEANVVNAQQRLADHAAQADAVDEDQL